MQEVCHFLRKNVEQRTLNRMLKRQQAFETFKVPKWVFDSIKASNIVEVKSKRSHCQLLITNLYFLVSKTFEGKEVQTFIFTGFHIIQSKSFHLSHKVDAILPKRLESKKQQKQYYCLKNNVFFALQSSISFFPSFFVTSKFFCDMKCL